MVNIESDIEKIVYSCLISYAQCNYTDTGCIKPIGKIGIDDSVFELLKSNNIEPKQIKIIRQLEKAPLPNLYEEQFEYFGSDGNLVSGFWGMMDEYERLKKNPIYQTALYLICSDTEFDKIKLLAL